MWGLEFESVYAWWPHTRTHTQLIAEKLLFRVLILHEKDGITYPLSGLKEKMAAAGFIVCTHIQGSHQGTRSASGAQTSGPSPQRIPRSPNQWRQSCLATKHAPPFCSGCLDNLVGHVPVSKSSECCFDFSFRATRAALLDTRPSR